MGKGKDVNDTINPDEPLTSIRENIIRLEQSIDEVNREIKRHQGLIAQWGKKQRETHDSGTTEDLTEIQETVLKLKESLHKGEEHKQLCEERLLTNQARLRELFKPFAQSAQSTQNQHVVDAHDQHSSLFSPAQSK